MCVCMYVCMYVCSRFVKYLKSILYRPIVLGVCVCMYVCMYADTLLRIVYVCM